jgi:peptidoglycan/LPS O-acetylase OafA/YrhL
MALCHWWFASERRGEAFQRASAVVCLAALLGWFVAYHLGFWETGLRVLNYGVPSFFFVGASLFIFREAKMPWLLVLLGDASYSLYLLHPFPVIASNKVLKLYDGPRLEDLLWSAVVTAACLAASVVMYKGFELPLQRFLRRRLLPPQQKPPMAPPLDSGPLGEVHA